METGRVALIRYAALDGTQCVGSGLLINDQVVLTADHVAEGSGHQVDCMERSEEVVHVLRSGSPDVDLAILRLKNPIEEVSPLGCARIEQNLVGQIHSCTAVGFPRWKRDGDRRRSAQVDGTIPTGEGLEATVTDGLRLGFLTLVGNRMPASPIQPGMIIEAGTTTIWGGMSGAVVVANDLVIGVVRSANLAADGRSLTVTPLTAIDDLAEDQRRAFWEALRVPDPEQLPRLPAEGREQSLGQVKDYEYDVYISYWPESFIDPWVRNRFIAPFKSVLLEELGRHPSILVARDTQVPGEAIAKSRVLLAILSKQYFSNGHCRAAFESMLQRQIDEGFSTDEKPIRLVHAIVAHDHLSDDSVPLEYRGTFQPINFKDWAYDFEIQDWQTYKSFNDAIGDLAGAVAAAVTHAPAWRSGFPLCTPTAFMQPTSRKPTL